MLINEVFPEVKRKGVTGLEKVSISTMEKNYEVEFFLVLQFNSLAPVKIFACEKYDKTNISNNTKRILSKYDRIA